MTRFFIAARIFIVVMAAACGVATATPLPKDSIVFFGRWDLRTPDRATTVNSGSYLRTQFTGSSLVAQFDLSLNPDPVPTIAWRIDNGDWQEANAAPSVKLADNLHAGPHTLWLMVRGLPEGRRWVPPLVGGLTFLGLETVADGKLLAPLDAWLHPKLTIEFLGDSITEGVAVQTDRPGKTGRAWQSDALDSYPCQAALLLKAEWRQVGFGYSGLLQRGAGNDPGALNSFNFFYDGCPRDNWQPDLVVINQGTNEGNLPPSVYQPLYVAYMAFIRQAYPNAKIVAMRPFNGSEEKAIKDAVASSHANGDHGTYYLDTTGWYSGDTHPNSRDSLPIASKLAAALQAEVLSDTGAKP